MSRLLVTVQHFDELAVLPLKRQSELTVVREEVGEAVINTISDDAGELGYFAIRPGPALSPWVHLEFFSRVAGKGVTTKWPAPRSILDKLEVTDERGCKFLNLCKCIFAAFEGEHDLDESDGPYTVWEFAEQKEATSGSGEAKSTGGRPREAEDNWAYQEIEEGRDQAEVYKEWLEKISKIRRAQLADPLDSFKKAMRYRKKREKREKRE